MIIARIAAERPQTWGDRSLGPLVGGAVKRWLAVVDLAARVRRERRDLAVLDDRMLKDIGLSRSLAHIETERDLLDLPRDRLDGLG